jgi:ATP-binding cassette subfamily B protein
MAALAVGAAINLFIPQLARDVVNEGAIARIVQDPTPFMAVALALLALQAVAFYLRALWFGSIGHQVVAQLRGQLFDSILAKDADFFDRQKSSDLVSRITADCAQIQDALSVKLSVILRYSIQVLVGVVLMALITPRLTVILVIGIPVLIAVSRLFGAALRRASRNLQTQLGHGAVVAEEIISGHRVVKAFSAELRESLRFKDLNNAVCALGIGRTRIASLYASSVNFLMSCFLVGVVLYGVSLVHQGAIPAGDLTAFLMYGVLVGVSFGFLVGAYAEFAQSIGGSERVVDILGAPGATPTFRAIPPDPTPVKVEFKDVHFAYPSRPESPVLRGLSMTIEAGQTVAIVGASGAGKTSIAALLLGLYQPQAGEILINGQHLGALKLRSKLAYVPQEPWLFGVSLRENLLMGNPDATEDQMRALLAELGMGNFLQTLPQGLDTLVGDRGLQLSGGQRQRIALARALLRNAGLLILDEATSGVDGETEERIRVALRARHHKRSMLIIAHRLATVRDADRIIVLESGSVVESGTHAELIASGGSYAAMVKHQDLSGALHA